jgi:hypothetical protein
MVVEEPLFLVKGRSSTTSLHLHLGVLMENAQIDEQLANTQEGVYTFRGQGTV